jgi:serine O-acetyltransferase
MIELNVKLELIRWFSKSVIELDYDLEIDCLCEALIIFKSDYLRYFPEDTCIIIEKIRTQTELQGILLYRIARLYYLRNNKSVADRLSALGRFLSGFEIYYSANIGSGLKINHGLGTVIGARSIIGSNVLIHQGVTLGDKNGGRPNIGDFVTIYAGAKILGEITVGNYSVIGANTVLLIDVPPNSVAVGNPGKILRKK